MSILTQAPLNIDRHAFHHACYHDHLYGHRDLYRGHGLYDSHHHHGL